MVAFLRLPFTSWHALQTLNLALNSRSVLGSGMTSAVCAGAASAARTTRTPKTICVRKNFLPRLGVVGELNYSPRTGRRGVVPRQYSENRWWTCALQYHESRVFPGVREQIVH